MTIDVPCYRCGRKAQIITHRSPDEYPKSALCARCELGTPAGVATTPATGGTTLAALTTAATSTTTATTPTTTTTHTTEV
jgi:hypothetical protein